MGAENLENQKEASSSADAIPQRLLLLEQIIKKAEHSIPEVDGFLIKATAMFNLYPVHIDFIKWDKFFEVWVCLIISPLLTKDNSLIFEDGTCFTRQQLELIHGIDFVNAFVQFLLSLQTFSRVELKLFTTVAVLNRPFSDDFIPSRVDLFHDNKNIQSLKKFCAGFFDCDISQKLMELWDLVRQHNDTLAWLRTDHWPRVRIKTHIAPRLNIPIPINMRELRLDSNASDETKKNILWKDWASIMQLYMQESIKEFNGKDCFKSLSTYDQACLFKHGLIEIWFCSVSPGSTEDAIILQRTGFTKRHLQLMYGTDFANAFTETLLSLQEHQLSLLEMKLLQDIVLFNRRPGLDDVEAVQRLQDRAIENFLAERSMNQKNTNDVNIPTLDIPQMLSKLQSLSVLHLNSLDWLIENSKIVCLRALFCEVFDIPNFVFENV